MSVMFSQRPIAYFGGSSTLEQAGTTAKHRSQVDNVLCGLRSAYGESPVGNWIVNVDKPLQGPPTVLGTFTGHIADVAARVTQALKVHYREFGLTDPPSFLSIKRAPIERAPVFNAPLVKGETKGTIRLTELETRRDVSAEAYQEGINQWLASAPTQELKGVQVSSSGFNMFADLNLKV